MPRHGRTLADIRPNGAFVIGPELMLDQVFSAADGEQAANSPTDHPSVPLFSHDYSLRKAPYVLTEVSPNDEVRIANRGLCNAYGIFGAPGTGKTHLMLQLLRQAFEYRAADVTGRFGCLILDPKAALLDKLEAAIPALRRHDLLVLRSGVLPEELNIIDCALPAGELARMLVLAAQSAGVSAMEPFWFMSWTNLFAAAIVLLQYDSGYHVTLRGLLDAVLLNDARSEVRGRTRTFSGRSGRAGERGIRIIEAIAEDMDANLDDRVTALEAEFGFAREQVRCEIVQAVAKIRSFYSSDYVHTIDEFITNAYGAFQTYPYFGYSRRARPLKRAGRAQRTPSLYDSILESGKIVVVGIGPSEPGTAKVLCTLVKCLFQQAVMSRRERCLLDPDHPQALRNFERPVLIACDEYSEIASEVPGQSMGDGRFFSLARENACMGLLATQSVHVLQNSSLKDSWRSVFSNFAAKIFMGAADNETAKEASDLAGQVDWRMTSWNSGMSQTGPTSGVQHDVRERPALPTYMLTQVLQQGQAVIIGSLDGRCTPPSIRFVQVPAALRDAVTGSPYSALIATNGTQCIVSVGSLPPGLTVEPDGHLTGTPTVAGTFRFGIRTDVGENMPCFYSLTVVSDESIGIQYECAATPGH